MDCLELSEVDLHQSARAEQTACKHPALIVEASMPPRMDLLKWARTAVQFRRLLFRWSPSSTSSRLSPHLPMCRAFGAARHLREQTVPLVIQSTSLREVLSGPHLRFEPFTNSTRSKPWRTHLPKGYRPVIRECLSSGWSPDRSEISSVF